MTVSAVQPPHGARASRIQPERQRGGAARLLVVEDEPALADALEYGLQTEGFEVVSTSDGATALPMFAREQPDLVLLDVMLPGMSGIEICRRLRASSTVPIIMLTARDTEVDKVVGLELGADDYVTKPFSMRELVARIRAVLRRGADATAALEGSVEAGGVRVDADRYEVHVDGQAVELPPKEFALLELLVRNAGRVLTREVILDRVWGTDYVGDSKTLDVHIKRLRQRLGQGLPSDAGGGTRGLIRTVRGVGYKFADD